MCDSARVENWGPSGGFDTVSPEAQGGREGVNQGEQLTHADDGALVVQDDTVALEALRTALDDIGQLGVKRIREADVADEPLLEEGEGPDALGAVDGLVRHDKVHGLDLLPQRADGGEGDDGAHADVAQGGDVGAVGHLVRRELVVDAVARDEGDEVAAVLEDLHRRRREAPGRLRVERGDGDEALELAQARAADDADVDGLCSRAGKKEEAVQLDVLSPWKHQGTRPVSPPYSPCLVRQGGRGDVLSKVVGRSDIVLRVWRTVCQELVDALSWLSVRLSRWFRKI